MSNFKFLQSQESLTIEISTAQLSVYYLNTTLQYISPVWMTRLRLRFDSLVKVSDTTNDE